MAERGNGAKSVMCGRGSVVMWRHSEVFQSFTGSKCGFGWIARTKVFRVKVMSYQQHDPDKTFRLEKKHLVLEAHSRRIRGYFTAARQLENKGALLWINFPERCHVMIKLWGSNISHLLRSLRVNTTQGMPYATLYECRKRSVRSESSIYKPYIKFVSTGVCRSLREEF